LAVSDVAKPWEAPAVSGTAGAAPALAQAERQRFRPDVEGLRAVAILLVVLYHVNPRLAPGGYIGVDVFFVISGFLITRQLTRELESRGRISFLGFYARRARRILPAATLTVMVTALASALLLNPLAAQRAETDGLSAIYFGANFHFAVQGADYFNQGLSPSPFQHFWSLSVEEQFYIIWPLLLLTSSLAWLGLRRRGGTRRPVMGAVVVALAIVAGISLLESIRQTSVTSESWAYFSILTRAWELAVGAMVALSLPALRRLDLRVGIPLTWIGLACIAIAAWRLSDSTAYPGDAALLPVLGAAAVIAGGSAVARRNLGAQALLGTLPFQRVGAWSYSWYLWHWPALVLAPALLGHSLSELEGLDVAAVSLVIAVLSFVLVERPIRRMQVVVRRPGLGLTCAGLLAAAAVGIVALSGSLVGPLVSGAAAATPALTAQNQLTPAQLSADLLAGAKTSAVPSNLTPPLATATKALPLIVVNGCHLQHPGVKSKPCVYGDTTSKTSVVLFGDSHAAAWFPALDLIGQQQHWRLVDLTKAGCPPAEVNINFAGSIYTNCTQWRRNAMNQIAALHPALVITSWARYIDEPEARPLAGVPKGYGSTWQNGVAAIFKFLHSRASHVLFLSDTPTLQQWAPDCVSGHLSNVRPCMTKRSASVRYPSVKTQELALARRQHIQSLDPAPWFCTPTVCPVIVGNIIMYRDNAHMTPQWSDFIAPVLADKLAPILQPTATGARSGAHSSSG
jgi:peptidoglycan/LPS O-acetylase OafA/YrhL